MNQVADSMLIRLDSIDAVKQFVNITNRKVVGFDIDMCSIEGRPYVIDAKSIMGIFSLDLSKPVKIVPHADDETRRAYFEHIAQFKA